jgi:uncharacterized protein YjbI with pentapeptide repeats
MAVRYTATKKASVEEVAGLADTRTNRELLRKLFGRRAVRVVGGVALFVLAVVLLFLVLNWYVAPKKPGERKDLVLAVAQILGGTALLSGLYFTWRTLQVNREGQITDRFTTAIDQLGKVEDGQKLFEIRIGGIYALERIARESEEDYWPIMEVLTAYLRQHAPWPPEEGQPGEDVTIDKKSEEDSTETTEATEVPAPPAPDIQAIMTVLRRRTRSWGHGEPEPLDLRQTHLTKANLRKANLVSANFWDANLAHATLYGADLTEADLRGANLSVAYLERACFTKANLYDVCLRKALLKEANLRHAFLHQSDLSEANLSKADLRTADLSGANLEGVSLRGADLEGADLEGANLEGAVLHRANLAGASLVTASLAHTNLIGANLAGAKLGGANLAYTNLWYVDLSDADLSDTNLDEANLGKANLRGAAVTEEQLATCNYLKGATMPDGQTLKSNVNPDEPTFEEWLKSKGREENGETGSQS